MTTNETWDFILDCHNAIKQLSRCDNSIWEPVNIEDGKIMSLIDGRQMTMQEFLTEHPVGTFLESA